MMILDNEKSWGELFPVNSIPNILGLVVDTWNNFKKPNANELENPINQRFTDKLRIAKNEADLRCFQIRSEVGTIGTDGRIDIVFIPTGTHREEVYFAFECKRLRIPRENRIESNTSEYVGKQGMMCFISGKYSDGLNYGGMIAYVMDGKADEAIIQVKNSLQKKKIQLCLINDPFFMTSPLLNDNRVKETAHKLKARDFTIYHVFLAV